MNALANIAGLLLLYFAAGRLADDIEQASRWMWGRKRAVGETLELIVRLVQISAVILAIIAGVTA